VLEPRQHPPNPYVLPFSFPGRRGNAAGVQRLCDAVQRRNAGRSYLGDDRGKYGSVPFGSVFPAAEAGGQLGVAVAEFDGHGGLYSRARSLAGFALREGPGHTGMRATGAGACVGLNRTCSETDTGLPHTSLPLLYAETKGSVR
jgi:hypothetical protein